MFICHLYIFLGEVSVHVFCPFFNQTIKLYRIEKYRNVKNSDIKMLMLNILKNIWGGQYIFGEKGNLCVFLFSTMCFS